MGAANNHKATELLSRHRLRRSHPRIGQIKPLVPHSGNHNYLTHMQAFRCAVAIRRLVAVVLCCRSHIYSSKSPWLVALLLQTRSRTRVQTSQNAAARS